MLVSLALHGIALAVAVILLREPAPQALFIDLTRPLDAPAIDGAAASPASRSSPPAPPAARRDGGARDRTRRAIARERPPQPPVPPAAPSAPVAPPAAPATAPPPDPPAPVASPPPPPAVAPAPASAEMAVSPSPVPHSSPPPATASTPPSVSAEIPGRARGTFASGSETESTLTASHDGTPAPSSSPAGSGAGGGDTPRGDQRGGGTTALAVPGDGGRAGAEYGAYLALVRRRIQEVLRYPAAARRRGLTGSVHVEVTVEPSGRIAAVSLVTSSTHRLLDDAALEAVRALPPVPFPPDVTPRALRVRLPIVFELR
jgi:TonB family protein